MISSIKQRWSQKRNWCKRCIMGTIAVLQATAKNPSITKDEIFYIEEAITFLKNILFFWNESSEISKKNMKGFE